jgi:hypothetical protein
MLTKKKPSSAVHDEALAAFMAELDDLEEVSQSSRWTQGSDRSTEG